MIRGALQRAASSGSVSNCSSDWPCCMPNHAGERACRDSRLVKADERKIQPPHRIISIEQDVLSPLSPEPNSRILAVSTCVYWTFIDSRQIGKSKPLILLALLSAAAGFLEMQETTAAQRFLFIVVSLM